VEITQDHRNLVEQVKKALGEWHKFTIGIDGVDGAGKSTLARFLSWQTEISLIETDLFIDPEGNGFSYRYDTLQETIEFRHRNNRPIIIEGLFLLNLLNKINITCDYLIYLEKADHKGSLSWQEEIGQYNSQYEPKEKADFLFRWSDVSTAIQNLNRSPM